jgi:hypothetical protein
MVRGVSWKIEERELYVLFCFFNALREAKKKHPKPFHSPHEGYAVMKEEFDEFWDEIKSDDVFRASLECEQVGAMAMRWILDMYFQPGGNGTEEMVHSRDFKFFKFAVKELIEGSVEKEKGE